MTVEPSRFAQDRVRRFLFVATATLVLLSVGSTLVQLPNPGPPLVDPISDLGIVLTVIALVVLTGGGVIAAWAARLPPLWLATGALFLVSLVPFAGGVATGVTMSVVLVGVVVSIDRPWGASFEYRVAELLFGAAVLTAATSTGLLVYEQLAGYVSVLAAVGGSILVGTAVAAVASTGQPVATQPCTESQPSSRSSAARSLWRLGSTVRSGVATSHEWYPAWLAVLGWSAVVCVLHFGGMTHGLYTQFGWWDLMTHSLSGFGVAAVLYLTRPAVFTTRRLLLVSLPAAVVAIGAGFEVYEYIFRDFYEVWSVEYYLRDTVEDMLVNTVGAFAFGVLACIRR
jgi:hypothetical protein